MRHAIIVSIAFALTAGCEPDQDRSDLFGSSPPAPVDAASGSHHDAGADASPDGGIICSPGLTACGSTCVDLQTDASNCGDCGRQCGGTACTAGMCGTTVLAQGQAYPSAVAVDSQYVYWVNDSNSSAGGVRKIDKMQLGAAPIVLASGQGNPTDLVIDATSVYWVNATDGAVLTVPLLGGPTTQLAVNQDSPSHLALASGNLFWTDSGSQGLGSVMKKSIAGGAPTALLDSPSPDRIAANGDTVFYSDRDGLYSYSAREWRTISTGGIMSIAADGSHVYWSTTSGIFRAATPDGAPEMIHDTASMALAIDGTHLYFVEYHVTPTISWDIRRLPLAGGAPLTLASGQVQPAGLALDDHFLYWVNSTATGAVVRVGK